MAMEAPMRCRMELEAESSRGGNGGSSNRGEGASLLGTRIRIIGFINKEQLNNKEGVIIVAFNETTGKVGVRLDDFTLLNANMSNIAFLPHNLSSTNNLLASTEDVVGLELLLSSEKKSKDLPPTANLNKSSHTASAMASTVFTAAAEMATFCPSDSMFSKIAAASRAAGKAT